MSRPEIIAQLRVDNPTTELDGVVYGPGETVYENLIQDWANAMEVAQAVSARKTWPTVQQFLQEFQLQELAAVWASENPSIGALAILLLGWRADVWSDHALIVQGIAALQAAGILTPERAAAILGSQL